MLNKVLPRSITAESAGARCCAGKVSGPRPSRCPAYKMSTAKGPQRHRDTKAQRRAIKCDFSSPASVPLCLCVFVVPVIRHSLVARFISGDRTRDIRSKTGHCDLRSGHDGAGSVGYLADDVSCCYLRLRCCRSNYEKTDEQSAHSPLRRVCHHVSFPTCM